MCLDLIYLIIITFIFLRDEWKPGHDAEEEDSGEEDAEAGVLLTRGLHEVRAGGGPGPAATSVSSVVSTS